MTVEYLATDQLSGKCVRCGRMVHADGTVQRDGASTGQPLQELVSALRACVDVAKAWHGDVAWDIYYAHSPEMKLVREALAKHDDAVSTQRTVV